jgi:competence protein ComEA
MRSNENERSNERGKVNLNRASERELQESIRGVGSVTAHKIIEYREKHGRIRNYDELKQISDIDAEMERKIRDGSTL